MPEMGHSRHFDRAAITSDLLPNDKHFLSPSACPKGNNTATLKEKISTDQQSILIEADVPTVSAKKGQTEVRAGDEHRNRKRIL
jgi:hypothetical protein